MKFFCENFVAYSTVEPRLTTTSITRPLRHDDQISPVPLTGPHWRDNPGIQTTTTGLEGPKLQIHL
jgi:hypothetical protein